MTEGAAAFVVYYRASPKTPITVQQMKRNSLINETLREKGFYCESVNVGIDPELQAKILRECSIIGNDEDWPIVYLNGKPVGGQVQLERVLESMPLASSGQEGSHDSDQDLVASPIKSAGGRPPLDDSLLVVDMRLSVLGQQFGGGGSGHEQPRYPDLEESVRPAAESVEESKVEEESGQLRTVDLALEGLEWAVVKGMGWIQSAWGSSTGSDPNSGGNNNNNNNNHHVESSVEESKTGNDFEVVQSNWYGRQQRRTLRVQRGELLRIHPMTGEIRARTPLKDIVFVQVKGHEFQVSVKGDVENEIITDTYHTAYAPQIIEAMKRERPALKVIVNK